MPDNGTVRLHFPHRVPIERRKHHAFTLAELLIALTILGIIASFTVPKVLQSQQNTQYKSYGKEAIAMVTQAFTIYQSSNPLTVNTQPANLTPYMNYIRVDSTSLVDNSINAASYNCAGVNKLCLQLHNGAMLFMSTVNTFGVADSSHYIFFWLDPDGQADVPGQTLVIQLFFDGRVNTSGSKLATDDTYISGSPAGYGADSDPSWFSWN